MDYEKNETLTIIASNIWNPFQMKREIRDLLFFKTWFNDKKYTILCFIFWNSSYICFLLQASGNYIKTDLTILQ